MSCKSIQNKLSDLLEGRLDSVVRREIETHVGECAECASVMAMLRLDVSPDDAPDLTASVLERTTGSACGRAEELLCGRVDGELEGLDAELLGAHLDGCDPCATLETALARLGEDLPAMAELHPGPGFVEGVLAATEPQPARWAGLAARWSRAWAAMVARPRIAWEAGYVGAIAVWIAVSLAGAPFQAGSVSPADTPVKIVDGFTRNITQFGQNAWAATGERGIETWRGWRTGLDERFRRSEGSRLDMRQESELLKDALIDFDFKEGGRAWTELTGDARDAWKKFASGTEDQDAGATAD